MGEKSEGYMPFKAQQKLNLPDRAIPQLFLTSWSCFDLKIKWDFMHSFWAEGKSCFGTGDEDTIYVRNLYQSSIDYDDLFQTHNLRMDPKGGNFAMSLPGYNCTPKLVSVLEHQDLDFLSPKFSTDPKSSNSANHQIENPPKDL